MKLFFHYCSYGFSNCYVLGDDENNAVIIDPGSMDKHILKNIENNNFSLRAVLVTHDHLGHVRGLRTLKRIYDAEIFAVNRIILDHKTTLLRDGDKINIGSFTVEVISIPGHSADSAVYRIGALLFTGDALTAGMVGQTVSAYGAATQMYKLRSRLLSLPGDYTVLPGHGPPSSLEAERRFNIGINRYDQRQNRKSWPRLDGLV
jgi:glyoxylase-like metal-dependent hydrolase (beta-lactamase superfamily II)